MCLEYNKLIMGMSCISVHVSCFEHLKEFRLNFVRDIWTKYLRANFILVIWEHKDSPQSLDMILSLYHAPSYPQHFSLRIIFILSAYLLIGLPSGCFPTKILYPFFITYSARLGHLDYTLLTILGDLYRWNSSSCDIPNCSLALSYIG
jgi:hypothetical protein